MESNLQFQFFVAVGPATGLIDYHHQDQMELFRLSSQIEPFMNKYYPYFFNEEGKPRLVPVFAKMPELTESNLVEEDAWSPYHQGSSLEPMAQASGQPQLTFQTMPPNYRHYQSLPKFDPGNPQHINVVRFLALLEAAQKAGHQPVVHLELRSPPRIRRKSRLSNLKIQNLWARFRRRKSS